MFIWLLWLRFIFWDFFLWKENRTSEKLHVEVTVTLTVPQLDASASIELAEAALRGLLHREVNVVEVAVGQVPKFQAFCALNLNFKKLCRLLGCTF